MLYNNWKVVRNYDAVDAPAFSEGAAVRAELPGGRHAAARFEAVMDGFDGGVDYRVTLRDTKDEGVRRVLYYAWLDRNDDVLYMGHAGDGTVIDSPERAVRLRFILLYCGCEKGSARLQELDVSFVKPHTAHVVRLAAAMCETGNGVRSIEGNLACAAKRIDAAAAAGADLVLLTETYNTRHVGGLKLNEGACPMDGPAVQLLRDKAKEHAMFVAASVRLLEKGLVSNTVLLFDRKGELAGRYTKTHLTMSELWSGMVPGDELPVFETEIGRIGFAICWDIYFPELGRTLFLKGADVVLNPTAGVCPEQHAATGYTDGVFIVTANCSPDPTLTRVTDRLGQNIATADPATGIALASVDLNAHTHKYWLSAPDTWTDPRTVFLGERRPDLYGLISDETTGY